MQSHHLCYHVCIYLDLARIFLLLRFSLASKEMDCEYTYNVISKCKPHEGKIISSERHSKTYFQLKIIPYSLWKIILHIRDQAWGQHGWILAKFFSFFLHVYGPQLYLGHKHAEKERGQYPAILAEEAWSIKDLLYGKITQLSCRTQWVIPSRQDGLPM